MTPIVLDYGTPYSWALMPAFLERVREFSQWHTQDGVDPLTQMCAAAFGTHSPHMLMIAIMKDDQDNVSDALVGHIVAGVETFLGRSVGMVYQFERDAVEDWKEINRSLQVLVDTWARSIGLDEIMAMAESDSRARLFGYFGYERGPVLLRRKFDG